MTDRSDEDDAAPSERAEPNKPRAPKRGAFPTPAWKIRAAPSYVPNGGEAEESAEPKPQSPPGDGEEADG